MKWTDLLQERRRAGSKVVTFSNWFWRSGSWAAPAWTDLSRPGTVATLKRKPGQLLPATQVQRLPA